MSWTNKPDHALAPASDINMIPLIDVMLVLLIIFMLTAPLLTHSVPVNLPQTEARTPLNLEQKIIEVTIFVDGSLYFDQEPVSREKMQELLTLQSMIGEQQIIHIRADEFAPYHFVAETIADIHNAGITNIGLVNR